MSEVSPAATDEKEKRMWQARSCGHWLALVTGLIVSGVAAGDLITYDGPNGGNWSVPTNWDLGRCPAGGDEVWVVGNSVYYDAVDTPALYRVIMDESAGIYGAIFQLEESMVTWQMWLGLNGDSWYWMDDEAQLTVDDKLSIGHEGPGEANFHVGCTAGGGLSVGGYLYVGRMATGYFEHASGPVEAAYLTVGHAAPGSYAMSGGALDVEGNLVVGNLAAGTLEQTAGTINETALGMLLLGQLSGGYGEYVMRGGEARFSGISMGCDGDGFFTQSGGTVSIEGSYATIQIGIFGANALRSEFVLNEDDGAAVLSVEGDILVAPADAGRYRQSAGEATVAGALEVHSQGDVLLSGGTLDAGSMTLYGYVEVNGGVLKLYSATLDGDNALLQIDQTGDVRIDVLHNTEGTVDLASGRLSGHATSQGYAACIAYNDYRFNMSVDSEFVGLLKNYGRFTYLGGDFSSSALENNGTFENNAPFTCALLINNSSMEVTGTRTITVAATGGDVCFHNTGTLTMQPNGSIELVDDRQLLNTGDMYAGGPGADYAQITGDVVNEGYLRPSATSAVGRLHVTGDFTIPDAAPIVRVRISGAGADEHDRLTVGGNAELHGKLEVRLIEGFVPSLGDAFAVLSYGSYTGHFIEHTLPNLPVELAWQLEYAATDLILRVVAAPYETGDMNCDYAINFDDINPFVMALVSQSDYEAQYPDCEWLNADCDGNGSVNFDDISPFVDLMVGG